MRSLETLAEVLYDVIFDIPDCNHPVEPETTGAQFQGYMPGIVVRYVPEQNFIADGQQSTDNMRTIIQHLLILRSTDPASTRAASWFIQPFHSAFNLSIS
jgi:hypothetical protein